jgi:flagellar hook-length control protein FliK
LPAPQTDPTSPSHFVSDAQLSQTAGRSEMRIAVQSNDLGNIELHAKVSGDSLGANITVEKRDAHTALATDLPALQQALSDRQLRVDQISLMHGPLHATAGDSPAQHFAGQGQGGQRQASGFSHGVATGTGNFLPSTAFSTEAADIFDAQGRLSVLA